ncbi:hypothetical protein FQA39_LY04600 [Lamprigera yunnana]|nr:hypothetical protein FQA39_LY04600 [Lamprigera yunnana]
MCCSCVSSCSCLEQSALESYSTLAEESNFPSTSTEESSHPSMPAEDPSIPSTSAMMPVFPATFSFDEATIPTGSVTPPPISTARFTEPENEIPFGVSPKDNFPLPQAKKTTELQLRRRCQKSEIITSSPFKNNLIEKAEKKKVPMKKCNNKKQKTKGPMEKRCHETLKNRKAIFPQPPKENSLPEETIPCRICDKPYGNSTHNEIWIQCNRCQHWAHKLCTDYEQGVYICDLCKEDVCSRLGKK